MIKKMVSGKSIFANKTIFTFDSEALKYLLIKNKKVKSKKDIQDIEKYEFQKLYIGNIYSEKENYYFYSLQDFLRIINDLKDKYKNLMLIAHNLKYDLKLIGLLDLFIKENMFLGMIEELLKDKYKENWIKFRRELFYRIKYKLYFFYNSLKNHPYKEINKHNCKYKK